MLYAILCYNDEEIVWNWSKEENDATMARLQAVNDKFSAQGRLGPVARLIGSLVDIGRSLSIKVVAEGVETMDQATILRDLGCDILQGYAFARPMPAAAFEQMLRTRSWLQAS